MLPHAIIIDPIIERALREDLGSGDITTDACVDQAAAALGEAIARQPLVVAGGEVFARVFHLLDPRTEVELLVADGSEVPAGEVLWRLRGRARALLMGERVALNLVQRMCGIATQARRYVKALLPGSPTRITDTRKTTPGLRAIERYAVRAGGAHNHRDDLGSGVMIKDNHIVAAGGIVAAVERARANAPHASRIEVEVTGMDELEQALDAGADVVLLDNMDTASVRAAVERCRRESPAPIVEASGGITLERVRELCETGVDVISVGALTHSAPAADISLELRGFGSGRTSSSTGRGSIPPSFAGS